MRKHARRNPSCETLHASSEASSPPIAGILWRRGLPECPLLRIRQAWPYGRRLLTCLCGQLLPPCGYVWLLQLGNPDPLWLHLHLHSGRLADTFIQSDLQ